MGDLTILHANANFTAHDSTANSRQKLLPLVRHPRSQEAHADALLALRDLFGHETRELRGFFDFLSPELTVDELPVWSLTSSDFHRNATFRGWGDAGQFRSLSLRYRDRGRE